MKVKLIVNRPYVYIDRKEHLRVAIRGEEDLIKMTAACLAVAKGKGVDVKGMLEALMKMEELEKAGIAGAEKDD